jgi:choline kinase
MKAIILAAGRGSRMGEITDQIPKCLVKVDGKPLIEWQLDAMKSSGIKEIGVVTGYKREVIANYNLTEFLNPDWSETNMVYSLNKAEKWLNNNDVIVSYSDIFYEPKAIYDLKNSESNIGVSYDPEWLNIWQQRFLDPLTDAETFKLDAQGNIVEIGRKPKDLKDIDGQYMGLLRFSSNAWEVAMKSINVGSHSLCKSMDMTSLIQHIINKTGLEVKGIPYRGLWGEVDSVSDLELYNSWSTYR